MDKLFNILKSKFGETRSIVFIEELFRRYKQDGVSELGAQLTYYLILAIFPFIIFLLNIIRITPLSDINVLERIFVNLPLDTRNLLINIIGGIVSNSNYTLLSMGALGGIWSASNGIMALVKAVNRAYDLEENRPYWKLRGLSILLTLGLTLVLIIALGILVFGETIFKSIFTSYTWPSYIIWKILQLTISIVLIGIMLSILYKVAPSIKDGINIKLKYTIPGGILSAIGLVGFSILFSFYVNNFGNYSNTYGGLGAVIILLIWLYVSSTIIILGAEVDATLIYLRDKSIKSN